ncbi:MAG: DUF669 domain-containing protein [Phycisphaeraceae bacterium]
MSTTSSNTPDGFDPRQNGTAFDAGGDAVPDAAPVTDLSAFDDDYEQTDAAEFQDVPDGKYQVRVHSVKLAESQKGDPMLKWDLVVISGQHSGRHIFKNAVITQASLPFVKGDLQTLGLKLPKFSELPKHLDTLLDQSLEVTKRTKGEFSNVYFNRRLEVLESDALSDEPIPF